MFETERRNALLSTDYRLRAFSKVAVMPILVKCNASDFLSSDPFSVTMLAEEEAKPAEGDEVFIWTSELPRQGPRGIGLEARGYLNLAAVWCKSDSECSNNR